jgi:hypothetical protein
MSRLKDSCCIFLITCAGISLASEAPRQEEVTAPILVAIQAELGLVSASTKETIRLQKEASVLQEVTLAKTSDILAQEKLQSATFDKTIDALRLEHSSAQRNALWATSFLGVLLILVIITLWLPLKKRTPSFGAPSPSDKDDGESMNEKIQASMAAIQPLSENLEANETAASKLEENVGTLRTSPPLISNIQIEKAVPLFYEDQVSYQPIMDPLSNDLSIILAQAEKMKQESLVKISSPPPQVRIPLINLSVRYPNALGTNRNSIKEKIIRSKISSMRELSGR